jgi:hypothetical protein
MGSRFPGFKDENKKFWRQFVDEYFSTLKVLDLSNRRNLSEEAFKVTKFLTSSYNLI